MGVSFTQGWLLTSLEALGKSLGLAPCYKLSSLNIAASGRGQVLLILFKIEVFHIIKRRRDLCHYKGAALATILL